MKSPVFIQTNTEALSWFFIWGNILFLGVVIALILYVFLHSYFKEINALVYRLVTAIPIILIIPSIVFSLVSYNTKVAWQDYIICFFIAGLVGGIIPIISSIVYAIYSNSSKREEQIDYPVGDFGEESTIGGTTQREDFDARTKIESVAKTKGYIIDVSNSRDYKLKESNIIGRGSTGEVEGNKISLNDPYISRTHATIEFDGNRFRISDSSSKSGTYINGQKIKGWVTLDDNDEIKVGKTYLKFTQTN